MSDINLIDFLAGLIIVFWGVVIAGALAWAIGLFPRRGKGRDIF